MSTGISALDGRKHYSVRKFGILTMHTVELDGKLVTVFMEVHPSCEEDIKIVTEAGEIRIWDIRDNLNISNNADGRWVGIGTGTEVRMLSDGGVGLVYSP